MCANTEQAKPQPLTGITTAYLYAMITVFLFYTGRNGFMAIVEAKYGLYVLLTGLYILSMLVGSLVLRLKNGAVAGWKPKESQTARLLALFYLLVTWLSALLSRYWPYTVIGASRYEGALTISLYCISFILVSRYGRADRRLLMVFSVSALLFCIICVLQILGLNPLGLYPQDHSFYSTDVEGFFIGTIGNADLVSAFLCLCIPLLLIIIIRRRDDCRWLLLPLLLALLFILWRIQVLAGYIGVGMGCVIAVCIAGPFTPKQKKYLALILIGLLILLLALFYFMEWPDHQFLYELHEVMHGNFDDSFGSRRLFIWRNVWSHVPGRIITGHGPDTMVFDNFEYCAYYDEELGRFFSYIDVAHNEYLNVIYHQGIFGLAAFIGLQICCLVIWLKMQRDDIAAASLGAAALCYSIQAFFSFSMCLTAPFFWIVLALLVQRYSKTVEVDHNENESA